MIVRSMMCAIMMALCTGGVANAQDCPDGEFLDYNGNCAPLSWIGDGYCDGDSEAYGFNMCNGPGANLCLWDGGDCTFAECELSACATDNFGNGFESPPCLDQGGYSCEATECGDGVCEGSETDVTCPDDCIRCGDGICHASENALTCPSDCAGIICGDGVCESPETYETCPDDCSACPVGQVLDCADDDCHTEAWIGDGYCDGYAQQYGADLCCYELDGGDCSEADCEAPECGNGVCSGGETFETCPADCSETLCNDSFAVAGSTEDGDLCYSDGSGYFSFSWEGSCLATQISYGPNGEEPSVIDITANGFTSGFVFFGFGEYECLDFELTFEDGTTATASACTDCGTGECGDGSCDANEDESSCPADCFTATCGDAVCEGTEDYESCPDDCPFQCPAGQVEDCVDAGECHTETWIADGYCDGVAQQYGADFCCYALDGGDCTEAECTYFTPCADLNGDGDVNGLDLATMLGCWSLSDCGDMTGDGVTAADDLTYMLKAWGPSTCAD